MQNLLQTTRKAFLQFFHHQNQAAILCLHTPMRERVLQLSTPDRTVNARIHFH